MNPTLEYLNGVVKLYGAQPSLAGFVLKHGREFGPRISHPERGTMRECFKNAFILMLNNIDLTYCEGFATSILPMPHAWCINKNNEVIDITWKSDTGTGYYGIPFDREYAITAVEKKQYYGLIDDAESGFPLVRGIVPPDIFLNKTQLPLRTNS